MNQKETMCEQTSPVQNMVNETNGALSTLDKVVSELGSELHPILRDQEPATEKDGAKECPVCGLQGQLLGHKQRIEELTTQINRLRDQLCI